MKMTRWIGMVAVGVWCLGGGAAAAEDKAVRPRAERPEPARGTAKAEDKPVRVRVEKVEAGDKININAASKTELMKLDGVGPAAAQKIIAYRDAHGPFKRPQDLAKVEGVGKGVIEKNPGRITVK